MHNPAISIHIGDEDRGSAFRDATRHTRRVRILRMLLPAAAAGAVIAFMAAAALDIREIAEPEFDPGAVAVSGSTITMESPRLTGYNAENRPYEVTAIRAEQDITAPDLIDLDDLAAQLRLEGDGWTRLAAATGLFDNKTQKLQLNRDVKVASNTGYTAELQSAEVDLKRGFIRSAEPVKVTLDAGHLTADQLEIRQGGDIIVFYGKVRMTLTPSRMTPAEDAQP